MNRFKEVCIEYCDHVKMMSELRDQTGETLYGLDSRRTELHNEITYWFSQHLCKEVKRRYHGAENHPAYVDTCQNLDKIDYDGNILWEYLLHFAARGD
jgi:hypothetical protein